MSATPSVPTSCSWRGVSQVVSYNVCSGHAHRIGDILDALLSHARVSVKIRVDPSRFRPHDNPLLLGDHGRIQNEVGWKPEIPIARTLQDLLDYWREVV